jgi:hypothetical protein
VVVSTKNKVKQKIIFDNAWDMRYSTENGYIDRGSKFIHDEKQKSSILVIENSEYTRYFANQVSGTRPVDDIKNYILFDAVDTVVEFLTIKEPKIAPI